MPACGLWRSSSVSSSSKPLSSSSSSSPTERSSTDSSRHWFISTVQERALQCHDKTSTAKSVSKDMQNDRVAIADRGLSHISTCCSFISASERSVLDEGISETTSGKNAKRHVCKHAISSLPHPSSKRFFPAFGSPESAPTYRMPQ